jgi:hypothetical protein
MKLDYSVVEISNSMGELSSHYPSVILFPEYENQNYSQVNSMLSSYGNGLTTLQAQSQRQQTIYESAYDANKLRDLINKARFARYVSITHIYLCLDDCIVLLNKYTIVWYCTTFVWSNGARKIYLLEHQPGLRARDK